MWFGMSGPNKSLTSQSKFASLKPFVVPYIKLINENTFSN